MQSLRFFLSVMVFLVLVPTTLAQSTRAELAQSVVMYPERYAVSMPTGWTVTYRKAFGKTELTGDDLNIGLYTEEGVLANLMAIDETLTTSELLLALYPNFVEIDIPETDLLPYNFGGKNATIYNKLDNRFVALMQLEDATFVFADAASVDGEAFSQMQFNTVLAVLGSVTAGANVIELRDPNMAAAGEPCWISPPEDAGMNVFLRVGPGFSRPVITYLEQGDYHVHGRTRMRDGTVWFQLDPYAAAPTRDTIEVWVEAADVLKTGDCDLVADTTPPPVIVGGARPAPIPGANGRIMLEELQGVPPPEDSLIPLNGTYTIIYGTQGAASCIDDINTQRSFEADRELYGLESVTSALFVKRDGSAFVFAGIGFVRDDQGVYVGTMVFGNGMVEFFRVRPTGRGRLEGFRTQNIGGQSGRCSVSVPLVITQ
ncbi:MAG: hypothetical protein AAFU54_14210 [Chloroflexota bacterium]